MQCQLVFDNITCSFDYFRHLKLRFCAQADRAKFELIKHFPFQDIHFGLLSPQIVIPHILSLSLWGHTHRDGWPNRNRFLRHFRHFKALKAFRIFEGNVPSLNDRNPFTDQLWFNNWNHLLYLPLLILLIHCIYRHTDRYDIWTTVALSHLVGIAFKKAATFLNSALYVSICVLTWHFAPQLGDLVLLAN